MTVCLKTAIVVSEVVLICRPQSHSSNKPNMTKNVAMWK